MSKIAKIVEALGGKNMDVFEATKTFLTFDEFINSTELNEIYEGWQAKTWITKQNFRMAWVVNNKLYVHYVADGINFIIQEKLTSCIDSGGLYTCLTLEQGFIVCTNTAYDKCEHNRKIWRQREEVLTSVYTSK